MDISAWLQFILFVGSALFASLAIAVSFDETFQSYLEPAIEIPKQWVLQLFIIQKAITSPYPIIRRHKEERYFLDPEIVENIEFPSIDDEPSLDLSVIVPAYNEESRRMLCT